VAIGRHHRDCGAPGRDGRRLHHFRAGVVFADLMGYKMLTTSLLYQL
jgi:hypothetical protein